MTTIHHVVSFETSPHQVYEALMDQDNFALLTGAPAEIDRSEGGVVSLFGGQIVGRNVEVVADVRVVQAWRVASWDPGIFSLVRFAISAEGQGAVLTFDQLGFPPEAHADLDSGWHSMYWDPMRKHLAST